MKYLFLLVISQVLYFSISVAQNVGIGVANPNRAKLELNGAVGATAAIFGGEGTGISLQRDWPGIGFNQYYNGGSRYIGNGFAAVQWQHQVTGWMAFDFFPSGLANATPVSVTRGMTLTPEGHLGIGNAPPNGDLQFINSLNNRKIVLWETGNNAHQYYGFGIESGTLRYAVDGPGAAHRFYAANNSGSSSLLMTIGGNKKVVVGTQAGTSRFGINSADPQYALEIVQADHTGLVIIDPNTWNHWELKTEIVAPFGNYLFFRYNTAGASFIEPDGSYHSGSDYRLKKNIQPMPDLLSRLMQLNPKSFAMKYNNPGNKKSIGFIAQELGALFPELVSVIDGSTVGYKEIPDLHAVNYSGLSVLAIKAIQEQQQIIESLKKEVGELKQLLRN